MTADNTSSEAWADSAYRSQNNEKLLASRMLVSRIHRRKPAGRPMPQNIARAEAKLFLANIAYNFDWLVFDERARAMG